MYLVKTVRTFTLLSIYDQQKNKIIIRLAYMLLDHAIMTFGIGLYL